MESTITISFAESAENHAGMERLGTRAAAGFTLADFTAAKSRFEDAGCECELIHLVEAARVEHLVPPPEPAYLLIVRGGAEAFGPPARVDLAGGTKADALCDEQDELHDLRDTKALMRGRVVNKLARHNLCFAPEGQEPDYESGRGRVIAFDALPELDSVRRGLPDFFGAKAADLVYAEGNYYYNTRKCGIGFHGDSERRLVVALRFGATMPLHFQWYFRGAPVGRRVARDLAHGELFCMSEKAVGTDWRKSTIPTLRHAAGAAKYLTIPGYPAEY